jgi:hypothetical protein
MTSTFIFAESIREVITNALPEDTSLHGAIPELRYTYLPQTHAKCLRPDNMLVVGIRGAGKSFWWAALQNPAHRKMFGESIGLTSNAKISVGFGESSKPDHYPGKDTLTVLLNETDARLIWKSIIFKQLTDTDFQSHAFHSLTTWKDRVAWVRVNPEDVEQVLSQLDTNLADIGAYHLVLFDALDRTADDWKTMNQLVRGLLQAALDFRPFHRIRVKVFARPDQLEDTEVGTFPDASKILSQKTELYWPRHELYALFWQYLANADNGDVFRNPAANSFFVRWEQNTGLFSVPDKLRSNEGLQRQVFHAITGPWMGRDRRRGFPYTWLPNHLGDTRNQTSPRSFLSALRHAASDRVRDGQEFPLHYESIKAGVQKASQIRVREIQEDYPWVKEFFTPLTALSVPCSADEVKQIWQSGLVLTKLSRKIETAVVKLPPAHVNEGLDGVLVDLENLGLIERLSGGRINIPDVYRVGYGIGRRGGVKPAAR